MAGLLGDVWFYVSAAGFLVSLGLFVFLLGQYRAAVEASEDETVAGDEAASAADTVEVARPLAAAAQADPEPEPEPQPKPVPVVAAEKEDAPQVGTASAGGASPAVAYLQGIKVHMDQLDKEIASLRTVVAQQGSQGEAILKLLAQLAGQMAKRPAAAPEAQAAPAPVATPAGDKTQPPAAAEKTEPPKPAPAPAVTETGTVILPPMGAKPADKTLPAAAPKEEPAVEETRTGRKGPVWPI